MAGKNMFTGKGILVIGTLALLLLLAGCGQEQSQVTPKSAMPAGDTGKAVPEMVVEESDAAPPAPPAEAPAMEEKKTTATTASGSMMEETGATAPKTVAVSIKGFAFSPKDVAVNVGDTITWTNEDSAPHTVKITGMPESDELSKGDSWSKTFTEAGTFSYICGLHPSMKGTITVK
ncbi:cupredoxin family copper-binding protein [Candidatus Woesearchaeota archaeon]|nr:cupredoxin family copper-binding protein [Candidatus Woesearchaeota archaeon]